MRSRRRSGRCGLSPLTTARLSGSCAWALRYHCTAAGDGSSGPRGRRRVGHPRHAGSQEVPGPPVLKLSSLPLASALRSPIHAADRQDARAGGGENISMDNRERRRELRAAVFTANGEALVSLLKAGRLPEHAIQLIGDGLLAALAQEVTGARELALDCVTELRERDWHGDAELATALVARLGDGPAPMLRPLPVDLDELADVLEGDPASGGGRIDLYTGEVWPGSVFEYGMGTGRRRRRRRRTSAGCGSPPKVHGMATAIWSASSLASRTSRSQQDWPEPWTVGASSAGSGTNWRAGPRSKTGGTPTPTRDAADAREPGWPRRAIRPRGDSAERNLAADCSSALTAVGRQRVSRERHEGC